MANLIISYYGAVDNGCASAPQGSETVVTSGTSASGTSNGGAAVASLFSDTAHYFTVGDSPTASAADGCYLPANQLVWVDFSGMGNQVAAITA